MLVDNKFSALHHSRAFLPGTQAPCESSISVSETPIIPEKCANGTKTQAERTAASDRAMLDAGIALLLERGTEGATLAAIGERAGYSRGLATYRYGSKAGLFQEISNTVQHRWAHRLAQAVGGERGLNALIRCAEAYYDYLDDSPSDIRVLHILYFAGVAPGGRVTQEARSSFRRQVDDAERWVRQGIEDGDIDPSLEPRPVATQYVAHLAGITYLWLLSPHDVDLGAMQEEFTLTMRGRLLRPEQ